jgi:hypothetical protein
MSRTNLTGRQCRLPNKLVDKLTEHDATLDAVAGDSALAIAEQISTTGTAIAPTVPLTEIAISGTCTYALAAGTKGGQRKQTTVISAAATPNMTITGTFRLNGVAKTSIAHTGGAAAVGDGVELIWDGLNSTWQIVRQFGTLTIT